MRLGGVVIRVRKTVRTAAVIVALIMLFELRSAVYAAGAAQIYADEVTAEAGRTVLIHVKIKDNPGIMGFKITVEYDKAVLSSPTANNGALVSGGNFNDSIGVTPEGAFDVVWSGTQDAAGDGTVMILGFKAADKVAETEIKLTYSQPDTFNEKWEDVVLNCNDINVKISDGNVASETTSRAQATIPSGAGDLSQVDSGYIASAMEDALEAVGVDSIESLNDEQLEDFKKLVNNLLEAHGADAKFHVSDREGCEQIYNSTVKEAFVKSITSSASHADIVDAVDKTLEEYGAQSINKLNAEQKKTFTDDVVRKLKANGAQTTDLPDSFSGEQAIEIISELYCNENVVLMQDQDKASNVTSYIKWTAAGAVIIMLVALFIIRHQKKRREKHEETY